MVRQLYAVLAVWLSRGDVGFLADELCSNLKLGLQKGLSLPRVARRSVDVLEVTPPVDPNAYARNPAKEVDNAPPMVKLSFVNRFGDTEKADIKKGGESGRFDLKSESICTQHFYSSFQNLCVRGCEFT